MSDPQWLTKKLVQALHAESLNRFGGAPGIRDEGLLESALDWPRNADAYKEESSPFELAATYAHGLIKNHPFVDGNKRVGLLAARAFLFRNGLAFHPPEAETVSVIEGVAAGAIEPDALAAWLEEHSTGR